MDVRGPRIEFSADEPYDLLLKNLAQLNEGKPKPHD